MLVCLRADQWAVLKLQPSSMPKKNEITMKHLKRTSGTRSPRGRAWGAWAGLINAFDTEKHGPYRRARHEKTPRSWCQGLAERWRQTGLERETVTNLSFYLHYLTCWERLWEHRSALRFAWPWDTRYHQHRRKRRFASSACNYARPELEQK